LRYKGVLYMKGKYTRVVFQGVHMLMAAILGRAWARTRSVSSMMVFIGKNLPQIYL